MKPAEVTTPSDTEVRVVRAFNAPARLVWRAYTEARLTQRWLQGPGWTMPVCEMEVRPGGTFRWRWRNDADGKEFGFHGEYREVTALRRIVNTEIYDPGTLGGDMGDGAVITVEFTEENGVTTVTTSIVYKSKQARDAALSTGMTDGMEQSYTLLDGVLESVLQA